MFLLDALGILVFYNDAAERAHRPVVRRDGRDPRRSSSATLLHLRDADGAPMRRRDSPAGVAFFERRPAHHKLLRRPASTASTRDVQATAYPLVGAADELHGVVTVFWQRGSNHAPAGDAEPS